MLAVALPGSGRSTWLRQTLTAFGGYVVSGPLPDSPGGVLHLVGAGSAAPQIAAQADTTDLWQSGLEAAHRWPGAVLIGVDDLHLAGPGLLEQGPNLVAAYLRAGGLLAATSRRRPEPLVVRGRVGGWLREIGDDELAFTDAELAELAGVDPAAEEELGELRRLGLSGAGWATAAGTVARWFHRQEPRAEGLIDDLAAHLADQVLEDLDPPDHRALLFASVLPSSSVALIRALDGHETARRFADLRVRHPALAPRGEDGSWSSVHPLLVRGLRPRLDLLAPVPATDIVAGAAAWHRAEGGLREPVELLLAARRWSEALSLLVQSALRFAEEARHQEFLDLWDAIPRATWEHDTLAVLTGALLGIGGGRAEAAFDLLYRPPLTDFDVPAGTRAVADAIRAFLSPWSPDPVGSLAVSDRALAALAEVDEATLAPVTGVRARGPWRHLAQVGAARAEIVLGRWPAAVHRLEALADDETVGALVRLNQAASHARALALCGRLTGATEQAAGALEHAVRRGVPEHPALVDAHLALAEVALWRNDLTDADQVAAEAERRARLQQCATQVAAARAIRAGVAMRRGHPGEALTLLAEVEALPDGHPRHTVEAIRMRALHRTGAMAAARRLAESLPVGPATVLALVEVRELDDPELLEWQGDDEPASQVLAPLARALSRHRAGGDDAWVHLLTALDHAEPFGLLGPFAELPAAMANTLAALPARSPFTVAAAAAAQRTVPLAAGATRLTSTEVAVIAALGSPIPLREVADQLYVSTNTLKSHLRRIYRKLGVTSRAEAVAAARRLGLT